MNKAFEYYKLAANQGHLELAVRVGIFYEDGKGTVKDVSKTLEYYELVANTANVSKLKGNCDELFYKTKLQYWETKDFHCLEISPENYLLTYTLIQDNIRITRRSTIWRRSSAGWKILYHQGTIFNED